MLLVEVGRRRRRVEAVELRHRRHRVEGCWLLLQVVPAVVGRRTAPQQWAQRRQCCLQEDLQWDGPARVFVAPSGVHLPGGHLLDGLRRPTCTYPVDKYVRDDRGNVLLCIPGRSSASVGHMETCIVPQSAYAMGRPGAGSSGIRRNLSLELLPHQLPHRLDMLEYVCAASMQLGLRFHLQHVVQAAMATPAISGDLLQWPRREEGACRRTLDRRDVRPESHGWHQRLSACVWVVLEDRASLPCTGQRSCVRWLRGR